MAAAHKGKNNGKKVALVAPLARPANSSTVRAAWPPQPHPTADGGHHALPHPRDADDYARREHSAGNRCGARSARHRPVGRGADGHRRRLARLSRRARPRREGCSAHRREAESLLDQVRGVRQAGPGSPGGACQPSVAWSPKSASGWSRVGRTLVGLLGFFGATLVGFAHLAAAPAQVPLECRRAALRRRRRPRARASLG